MGGTSPGMGSCHRGATAVHGEILVEFDPPGPQGAPAMTATSFPTLAATLAELVDGLDDAVRAPGRGLDVPHAVGEALRPFLGLPGLLTPEQEAGDADRYRTHLLHEVRYRLVDGHLVEDGHTVGPCGEVTVLTPPGDIHAVVNDGTSVAASLHVYGADLRRRGTSVRRCYSLPVRSRSPRRPARQLHEGASAWSSAFTT